MANEVSNEELKKLLLPDAKFKMDEFERMGLYALLYNEINGSKIDYGYTKQFSFDLFIRNKIKSIMQAVGSCYSHKYDNVSEVDRKNAIITEIKSQLQSYYYPKMGMETPSDAEIEKLAEETYGHAQRWLKNLMPLADVSKTKEGKDGKEEVVRDDAGNVVLDPEKIDANKKYLKAFVSDYNFDRAVSEFQRLGGPDKLSIDELRRFFSAKKKQVDSTFEIYRKNQNYKAGRVDEEGKSKNGPHADHYFEGRNKLRKMNEKIRKRFFRNLVAGLAVAGLATLSVVSAGALLSYGGFALTAMFGNAFSALGVGGAVAGAIGTGVGFFGAKNLYHRLRVGDPYFDIGLNEIKQWRRERKLYKGTRYRGKDLPSYIAEAVKKDPKNATYHELEAMYFYDKGMYEYYRRGGDLSKVSRKYRKYLDPKMLKEQGLDKDQIKYEKAWESKGLFDRLENRFAEVVQKVEGKGEYTMSEAESHISAQLAADASVRDLEELSRFIDANRDKITGRKADNFQQQVSGKVVDTLNDVMFQNAYTGQTVGNIEKALSSETITERLKKSGTIDGERRIDNSLAFLKKESERNSDGSLSEDVGVSIGNQYIMKANNIANTCQTAFAGVSLTDDQRADVETVANAIQTMTTKTIDPATSDAMLRLAAVPRVHGYLDFMLKKKQAGSINSELSIDGSLRGGARPLTGGVFVPDEISEISSQIASLSRETGVDYSKKGTAQLVSNVGGTVLSVQDIRNNIQTSSLSKIQKTAAEELLQTQIASIERGERDRAREQAYTVATGNKDRDLSVKLKEISSLTYESIASKPQELEELFKKVTKGEAKEYLICQFKKKLEELCETEAKNVKYNGTSEETFNSIMQLLSVVNSNIYIDDAQKARITEIMTDKLAACLDVKLERMEIDYLKSITGTDRTNFYGDLRTFLEKGYESKGLFAFFNTNTPVASKIKARVNNLFTAKNVSTMLNADIGSVSATDNNSQDAQLFSLLYFSVYDDSSGGPKTRAINGHLNNMQNYSQSISASDFTQAGPSGSTATQFINDMKGEITAIVNDSSLDESSKLAALLVAKKRCMAAFKLNLQQYRTKNAKTGADITNLDVFFNTSFDLDDGSGTITTKTGAQIFTEDVISVWETKLTNYLDSEIKRMMSDPNVSKLASKIGYNNKSAHEFMQAAIKTGSNTYAFGTELQRS